MARARLSIVIPTKNRRDALLTALQSIGAQTAPVDEVVIVDTSSAPLDLALLTAAMGDPPVPPTLLYQWLPELTGLTHARNRGVCLSSGDIVQFMDDDTRLLSDYISHLINAFGSPAVGGAAGHIVETALRPRVWRGWFFRCFYIGCFRQQRDELSLRPPAAITRSNCLPGVSAYRRAVFDEFAFDEELTGASIGDDLDFSYRVARRWQLAVVPEARILHDRCPSGRLSRRQTFTDKVTFYHYHFRKNMRGSLAEWIAFAWLGLGFMVDAATRGDRAPLQGLIDGYRKVFRRGLFWRPATVTVEKSAA